MSPLFIANLRKELRCRSCRGRRAKDRKFCNKHLAYARSKWKGWQNTRRSKELCCYCPKKSINGWLRCRRCAIKNRIKCKKWTAAHYEERERSRKRNRNEWLSQGLCVRCGKRPIIKELRRDGKPYVRCSPCKKYQAEIQRQSKLGLSRRVQL